MKKPGTKNKRSPTSRPFIVLFCTLGAPLLDSIDWRIPP